MKKNPSQPGASAPLSQRRRGAALLIVLAFIVLVTGVVVAFFSRAMTERQVSDSSASQTKVEVFAQGAVDSILGDLKQEMAAGSTVTTITVNGSTSVTCFTPNPAASGSTAVPARTGTASAPAANFLKRSVYNQSFFSGAAYTVANNSVQTTVSGTTVNSSTNTVVYSPASRAVNVSSTTASLNQRAISVDRWNTALLIPKKTPGGTATTPDPNAFTAPDWILVARSGTNPTSWNSNMQWTTSGTNTVIGRYAYTIYDEGGLLDMNVAGHPTITGTADTTEVSRKGALAFADLTQLPTTSGNLSQTDVDKIINWRNAATASNYVSAVRSNTTGFLTVSSTGGLTDTAFINRQALINYLTSGSSRGMSISLADAQNLLQYLGTFSRDLEQPSYAPDPRRPKIVGTWLGASADYTAYKGNNDACGLDNLINPAFPTVRVSGTFARNDGSTAQIGEPLVKKRFALNRLAWLTYMGPSSSRNTSATGTTGADADIGLLKINGITQAWLDLGTQDYIYKYFGLYWDSTNKCWVYNHSSVATPSSVPATSGAILKLSLVQGREPDFVELLKASICVGSIGKGSAPQYNSPTHLGAGLAQHMVDTTSDYQTIQICANIIDQFDTDGFPTRIRFDNSSGYGLRDFYGIENLPYFNGIVSTFVVVRQPYITGMVSGTLANIILSGTGTRVLSGSETFTQSTGTSVGGEGWGVRVGQPIIWNPHDPSSSVGNPCPTTFRFSAETADIAASTSEPFSTSANQMSGTVTLGSCVPPGTGNNTGYPLVDTRTNVRRTGNTWDADSSGGGVKSVSNLDFDAAATGANRFYTPAMLGIGNLPAGSNLRLGPGNRPDYIRDVWGHQPAGSGSSGFVDQRPILNTVSPCIGFYFGGCPLVWPVVASGTTIWYVNNINDGPGAGIALTYRLEYSSDSVNYYPYDVKFTNHSFWGSGLILSQAAIAGDNLWRYYARFGNGTYTTFTDPRTARFSGMRSTNFPEGYNFFKDANNTVKTDRPNAGVSFLYNFTSAAISPTTYHLDGGNIPGTGDGLTAATAANIGWFYSGGLSQGLLTQNIPSAGAPSTTAQWYQDPDGQVRKAMGAYVPSSTTVGLPMAMPATPEPSRPIVLNRPFRSVSELGYVFSGTPWKNLDFFTKESGNTAMLDTFCINENTRADALVAGKVNLNTRQSPVLQAVMAGAYRDEIAIASGMGSDTPLAAGAGGEASTIANALVTRTGTAALTNIGDLVGRYASGSGTNAIYTGFSEDLTNKYTGGTSDAKNITQRMRETAIRALSQAGTARTWNLMIDLVAQTGRYPASASSATNPLAAFYVEGEQRYWIHVAIDRYTGEVIDSNIEVVKE